MGESASHAAGHSDHQHGRMEIGEHVRTFGAFMDVTVWGGALVVMLVAALTVAFAMGGGWFAGVMVWAALGVVAGVLMKLRARWWGALIGSTALFLIGGALAALIAGLAS